MSSIAKRPDGTYRARYRDAAKREHSKHFKLKRDAAAWLARVETSKTDGTYVDPRGGRITFREYAEGWRTRQVYRPTTAALVESILKSRVYPEIGGVPLNRLSTDHLQGLVATLSARLAPASVVVTHSYVSTILKAAVRARVIPQNPAVGITLPRVERKEVVPLSTDQVMEIADAMPPHLRALVIVTAGTGLRQGEAFGLTLDRVDLDAGTVRVDRQLLTSGAVEFGPPKTPTSVRTIPLPATVATVLRAHLEAFPPGPEGLIFTGGHGGPLRRSSFGETWRRVTKAAGLEGVVFHQLRHHYASLLIRHGESVKTVQARLGHKSAQETLDTYAHLWPDSDARTREAVDDAFAGYLGADSAESADQERPCGPDSACSA